MVMSKANGVTSPEQAKPHLSAGWTSFVCPFYLILVPSDTQSITFPSFICPRPLFSESTRQCSRTARSTQLTAAQKGRRGTKVQDRLLARINSVDRAACKAIVSPLASYLPESL
jgi:hypothetical protein